MWLYWKRNKGKNSWIKYDTESSRLWFVVAFGRLRSSSSILQSSLAFIILNLRVYDDWSIENVG